MGGSRVSQPLMDIGSIPGPYCPHITTTPHTNFPDVCVQEKKHVIATYLNNPTLYSICNVAHMIYQDAVRGTDQGKKLIMNKGRS